MSPLRWLLALAVGILLGGTRASAQVSPGPLARPHRELEGTLKCTQCHGSGKDAMQARCLACHRDVGWLLERGRGYHASAPTKAERCAACHPDHAGADFQLVKWPDGTAARFDHRRAGWPLEQSHATVRCERCHVAANRVSPAAALAAGGSSHWTGLEVTCTSCHQDPHRGALGTTCVSCHDAGKWTATPGFNHDSTTYPLTGRHETVSCDKCHLDARVNPKAGPDGKPIPIYRPVAHQTCAACHRDPHDGRLGATCETCHSTRGFAQISGERFDHGRTNYPLRGKHAAVKCSACHQDFSSDRVKRPAFATCAACHADQHGGSATLAGKSVDCAACHTENGFAPSSLSIDAHRGFRYPLEGKHVTVRCSACHRKDPTTQGQSQWGPARVVLRPGFGSCLSCHADQHGGQLAGRPSGSLCSTCHRVDGWKPSSFDRVAHDRLRLTLDGRHGEITCAACHGAKRPGLPPLAAQSSLGKAGFALIGLSVDCASCHVDPHRGRFEPTGARPRDKSCLACHNTDAFTPATVGVPAHGSFGFPLNGAHRATPCSACHRELAGGPQAQGRASTLVNASPERPVVTFEAPLECAACHRTPHGTQFDGRKDRGRCDACHVEDGFIPASRFDHERDAAFALGKGHQAVPCGSCHRPSPSGGRAATVYRPLSGKCESCHGKKP